MKMLVNAPLATPKFNAHTNFVTLEHCHTRVARISAAFAKELVEFTSSRLK